MLLLASHDQKLLGPATAIPQNQVPQLVDDLYQTIRTVQRTKARSEVNHAIDVAYRIRCAGFHSLWIKRRHVLWCLRVDVWQAIQRGNESTEEEAQCHA